MPHHCCVPGCRGNYEPETRGSVFSFPSDEITRTAWITAISRKDFTYTKASRVCHLHFQPNDVERTSSMYDHKTGKLITAPLDRPRLRKGAVPSVFPDPRLARQLKKDNPGQTVKHCAAKDDRTLDASLNHEIKERKLEKPLNKRDEDNHPTKCFVCNDTCQHKKRSLVDGPSKSKFGFPHQISQLIGEEFLVVVRKDDCLCKRCASLLNTMDELEEDLASIKEILMNYLKIKYVFLNSRTKNNNPIHKNSESPVKKARLAVMEDEAGDAMDIVKRFIGVQESYVVSLNCSICSFHTTEEDEYNTHMADHMKTEPEDDSESIFVSPVHDENFESDPENIVDRKPRSAHTVKLSSPKKEVVKKTVSPVHTASSVDREREDIANDEVSAPIRSASGKSKTDVGKRNDSHSVKVKNKPENIATNSSTYTDTVKAVGSSPTNAISIRKSKRTPRKRTFSDNFLVI